MRQLVTNFVSIALLGALAAPMAAQSPSTTEELLAGMVTEEIEPGVYEVVNDGVRDLAKANNLDVVAGLDGGIWLLRPRRFFRLGDGEWHGWASPRRERVEDFEVAPDGTIWTVRVSDRDTPAIQSFDGDEWTTQWVSWAHGNVEVTPDGRVWATWPTSPQPDQWAGSVFGYPDADGWHQLAQFDGVMSLFVASADDIYAQARRSPVEGEPSYLYRFTDGTWQRLPSTGASEGTLPDADEPLADDVFRTFIRLVDVGPDGTLWGVEIHGPEPTRSDLVRFDGIEWRRWPIGGTESSSYREGWALGVAPDGSVWVGLETDTQSHTDGDTMVESRCAGVGHLEGKTWHRYLTDRCIEALGIAADGSVWMLAGESVGEAGRTSSVYVITPEAVAAAE